MIKPIKDIDFFFPDENNKNFVMVTLSKPLVNPKIKTGFQTILGETEGIEAFNISGKYSVVVTIARTFNPDEIIEAIRAGVTLLLSDIILPNKSLVIT